MKKRTFLFWAFVSTLVCLQAQDTLRMADPKPCYYAPHWTTTDTVSSIAGMRLSDAFTVDSRRFVTSDTLTVYGIAISAYIPTASLNDYEYATISLDSAFEYLRVYKRVGDSMTVVGDSMLMLHMRDTPVSYYMDVDKVVKPLVSWLPPQEIPLFPIYEVYYNSPFTVTDSFFVGITNYHYHIDASERVYTSVPIDINGASPYPYDHKEDDIMAGCKRESDGKWVFFTTGIHLFMYPIIALCDTTQADTTVVDTTIVDTGDTVAIRMPEYFGRYVSVSPNPATGSAEVLSSFGLSRVEVFNAAGRKVMDLKAEGLKATLDVSKLPSGAYLLRIHTPQGMTTKKLVVR